MEDWKKAEEAFAKHCMNEGWVCHKLKDTAAVGVVVDSPIADFVIAKDFYTFFVEVKFSAHDFFPLKNIRDRKDQTAKILAAINRGVPILYALFTSQPNADWMSIQSAFTVLDRVYRGELTIEHTGLTLRDLYPEDLRDLLIDSKTVIRPKKKAKKGVVYAPTHLG